MVVVIAPVLVGDLVTVVGVVTVTAAVQVIAPVTLITTLTRAAPDTAFMEELLICTLHIQLFMVAQVVMDMECQFIRHQLWKRFLKWIPRIAQYEYNLFYWSHRS